MFFGIFLVSKGAWVRIPLLSELFLFLFPALNVSNNMNTHTHTHTRRETKHTSIPIFVFFPFCIRVTCPDLRPMFIISYSFHDFPPCASMLLAVRVRNNRTICDRPKW
ncbi:uncharacterized protein BO80DRAFT_284785 [Aspergillus ibericus CBS 121593]|uniref:Uncharacterized protein n=1 Tax=Aspergillus ibericus CBS 121593 TaxID=1448316 RepID=A0A395H774_9EURO|nr:hypothetical protein BO80DRAFT_284785 [Aspergillus ibericus CBS 121593]RAL03500.1 hypothetical protein BO80DRAFT_284785 [Aspergillus ibericus CBS 121593]